MSKTLPVVGTSEAMRKVVEEGREARNLLTWSVPLDEKAFTEVKLTKKPPTSPRPQSASPKPPRHAALSDNELASCHTSKHASSLLHHKSRIRSASAGRNPQKELRARYWAFLFENVRARYWAFLFENLHRAVDEIYQTCETDESVVECKEAIMMLENYTKEFHALIKWLHLSKNFENTPPPNRPTSLAWEVRKSSPGKNLLRDVFLDKCLASCSPAKKVLDFNDTKSSEPAVPSEVTPAGEKTGSFEASKQNGKDLIADTIPIKLEGIDSCKNETELSVIESLNTESCKNILTHDVLKEITKQKDTDTSSSKLNIITPDSENSYEKNEESKTDSPFKEIKDFFIKHTEFITDNSILDKECSFSSETVQTDELQKESDISKENSGKISVASVNSISSLTSGDSYNNNNDNNKSVIDTTSSTADLCSNQTESLMGISFMSPPNTQLSGNVNPQSLSFDSPNKNVIIKLSPSKNLSPNSLDTLEKTSSNYSSEEVLKLSNPVSGSVHKTAKCSSQISPRNTAISECRKSSHAPLISSRRSNRSNLSSQPSKVLPLTLDARSTKVQHIKTSISSSVASKVSSSSQNPVKALAKDQKTGSTSSLNKLSTGKSWADKVKGSTSEPNLKIEETEENMGAEDDSEGWETVRGRTRSRNSPAKKIPQKGARNLPTSTLVGKVARVGSFTTRTSQSYLQRTHTFHGTTTAIVASSKNRSQDGFMYSDKANKDLHNSQKIKNKVCSTVNKALSSKVDSKENEEQKNKMKKCEIHSSQHKHSLEIAEKRKNNLSPTLISENASKSSQLHMGNENQKVKQHIPLKKELSLEKQQKLNKSSKSKELRTKRQYSMPPETNKSINDNRKQKENSLPPMMLKSSVGPQEALHCSGADINDELTESKVVSSNVMKNKSINSNVIGEDIEIENSVSLNVIKELNEEQNSALSNNMKLQNKKKHSCSPKNVNISVKQKSNSTTLKIKSQHKQSKNFDVSTFVKHKNAINVGNNKNKIHKDLKCPEVSESESRLEIPDIKRNGTELDDTSIGICQVTSAAKQCVSNMTVQQLLLADKNISSGSVIQTYLKELQKNLTVEDESTETNDEIKVLCCGVESELNLIAAEDLMKEETISDNEKINDEFLRELTESNFDLDESDALTDDQEASTSHEDAFQESQSLDWYDNGLREEAQERVHQLGLSWGDQMDRLDLELRTPGRALQMHEKLSSPFRKRSLSETLRRQKEKQIKAQEQRERLLEEKAQKFKDIAKKVEEMRAWKEEKQQRQRIVMEQKLQRAQEKRKMQLQMIVRKAHDEEEKVNEIAFINTLEAQNKRHDLISKEKDHEARLQDIQEERQRKLEEKAAKEAAAEERRRVLEAERQARLLEMQEKRKLRDLKIEQQLLEKEKERQEIANQKARDRELRISALNAAQQATVEELQKKIQQKQEESARRHEENMEQIRQKAFELSVRRYSSNNDDAPRLVPYETIKMCSLCNVLIGSEVYLLSHLRGKKHQEAVKDQHQGQDPSTEELESYNLKHIVDAPADKLDPDIALDKERQKALKKRCKKLRQRMTNRGLEYETALEKKIEKVEFEHKQKMQRIIKDICKHLSGQGTGPWDINLVSSIERSLGELERMLEKCKPSGKVALRVFGGISVFMEILNAIGSCSTESDSCIPNRTLVRTCFVYSMACHGCYDNCHLLLFSNKIGTLLDLLIHRLVILIPDNCTHLLSSAPGYVAVSLPVDVVARSLMHLLAAILSCLSTREPGFTGIKHMIIDQNNPAGQNEEFQQRMHDVISYTVSIGIVDKLSQYLNNVRGPIDAEPEVADFLLNCMAFLTALTKLFSDSYELVFDRKKSDDTTQLVATFKLTELVGTVSLLYGTLLHSGAPSHGDGPPPQLLEHTVHVAVSVLKLLNQLAVMDLQMVQSVLGNEGLSLQLRHIASYFLWYCSHWECHDLLHEVILLVGYFTVLSPDNQAFIQAGQRPTVLQQLCSLPFQYFSDPPLTDILFPTLIACCHNNPHNKTILEQEMSPELLSNYIEAHLLDIHQATLFPSRVNKGAKFGEDARWLLTTRFPKERWTAAKHFFSTDS